MPGRRNVYWDACIFITWLTNEQRPNPHDLDGVAYVVEQWFGKAFTIVTSTISRLEVLECTLTTEQVSKFRSSLRRSDMHVIGPSSPIIDVAHEIRSHYESPRVSTPDAIHLATAIAANCDTFFTFDGQNPSEKKGRKLLPLGPVLCNKYKLGIELPRRPSTNQGDLLVGVPGIPTVGAPKK